QGMKHGSGTALLLLLAGIAGLGWAVFPVGNPVGNRPDLQQGLVGYWPLRGDCLDHSGGGNDGINHGADLRTGAFDGRGAYGEVPAGESLRLGRGDFSFSAFVHTNEVVDDTIGDVLSWYDPE